MNNCQTNLQTGCSFPSAELELVVSQLRLVLSEFAGQESPSTILSTSFSPFQWSLKPSALIAECPSSLSINIYSNQVQLQYNIKPSTHFITWCCEVQRTILTTRKG